MAAGIDEITQLALTLSVSERAEVASRLLESLDDVADPSEVHRSWTSEINSRVDDIVTGRVQTIPRDEVRKQLAADRTARQR
ncbi:addiction module protein [Ornithinimicrobium cryptoxanthini]|uniref:Addiction module protein n=1 Tax=Ornithinimicrobium cryptoxanthini TaxID=2934161 RepID=A0ABY4YHX1_9MICO|nr:addiction module protein [Ornithinimicrobium cryptoxanthini]USQ76131.1 addiction module protein [Ornithinimicrobium cryptoxanthini]